MASKHVVLPYGSDQRFECEIESDRLVAEHAAPRPNSLYKKELLAALRAPVDFPSIDQAVIPGDRVTLALDRHTPGAAGLVAGIWGVLAPRGIDAEKFTVIQPATRLESELPDPRAELPEDVRSQVRWTLHDPAQERLRLPGIDSHRRARLHGPRRRRGGLLNVGRPGCLRSFDGVPRH